LPGLQLLSGFPSLVHSHHSNQNEAFRSSEMSLLVQKFLSLAPHLLWLPPHLADKTLCGLALLPSSPPSLHPSHLLFLRPYVLATPSVWTLFPRYPHSSPHLLQVVLWYDLSVTYPQRSIQNQNLLGFSGFCFLFFFFFGETGVWTEGFRTYKAGALPLEPHLQSWNLLFLPLAVMTHLYIMSVSFLHCQVEAPERQRFCFVLCFIPHIQISIWNIPGAK
jgi:hypothetical protein